MLKSTLFCFLFILVLYGLRIRMNFILIYKWTFCFFTWLTLKYFYTHLLKLCKGCVDYGMLQKIGGSVVCSPGRTKLDRERTSLCLAEIVKIQQAVAVLRNRNLQESIGNTARLWRGQISSGNIREKYRGVMTLLERLKLLVNDVRLMIVVM